MFLCKVTGTIVATRKNEALAQKLLIVQPVDTRGEFATSRDLLAIDPRYGAGVGDMVLVAREGAVVGQLLDREDVPANVVILGVVDDWAESDRPD
jgi:microcompartment protein CcmK/EutM